MTFDNNNNNNNNNNNYNNNNNNNLRIKISERTQRFDVAMTSFSSEKIKFKLSKIRNEI